MDCGLGNTPFRIVVGKTVWKALARIMGRHGHYKESDYVLGVKTCGLGNRPPPWIA